MKVRLIHPINSSIIHNVNDIKDGAKVCYNELPKDMKPSKIIILNVDTGEVLTFKVRNHNKCEILKRIESKIDKLIKLNQTKMIEEKTKMSNF